MRQLVPHFILEKFIEQRFKGQFQAVSLFVDTSGFTDITEALMQHGHEGVEFLAQALQSIFEPLIQYVYSYGGFIANFSGDGFTALFPGQTPETCHYGLAAAWQIRQHMAVNASYPTRYGNFTFTVKASLARGQVGWGILPDTPNTEPYIYYFSGQAIDQAIQQEQHIRGGQVGLSVNIHKTLRRHVSTQRKDGLFQVVTIDGKLPAPVSSSTGNSFEEVQTAFFSPALHRLAVQGEFRQVLTMFINLHIAEKADDLPRFMTVCLPLLRQYGGYLGRIGRIGGQDTGYTLLLFWGAPVSHENDIERTLNFALDLKDAASSAKFRMGVTRQTVYAGFVGSSLRQEYTCYGLSVNQAARQMVAANWGEIWLDKITTQSAQNPVREGRTRFQVASIGKFSFKGISDNVPVYSLKGRQHGVVAHRYKNTLVGREQELAQLNRLIAPIFHNQFAGVITLYGEAGIGKSRLLYELKRQVAFSLPQGEGEAEVDFVAHGVGEGVAWFHCPADEARRRSLYPFRYFLRAYFEQDLPNQTLSQKKIRFTQKLASLIAQTPDPDLQRDLKRGESFLGALLDLHWPASLYEQVEPQLRHENSLDALKTLFLAESQIHPVIIELEDAHWLDDESVRFLRYLTHPLDGHPLVVIAACRKPLPDDWLDRQTPYQIIQLSSLTTTQMKHLAEAQLAAPVSFTLAEMVTDRTNGNPFFAEQLLRYLQDQSLLAPGETGLISTVTNGRIPTDIQAVLVAHLDRLLPDIKDIVQKAAVLGQEFDLPVLVLMCATIPDVEHKIQAPVREAIWLVLTSTHYLFRHALMRDAAYDMQLRARLRELHLLAGQALEQTFADNLIPHYAELAHHYRQAEDIEKERRYIFLAGEQAAAQYANSQAEAYFSRALEITPAADDTNRYNLYLCREAIYNLQGNRDEQQQDLIALEALADKLADRSKQAEVALRWANYAEAIDDYPTAITKAQQAIKLAQDRALHFEAEGHFLWGVALYKQSRNEAAHPRLEQALALTRKANLPNLEAQTLNTFGGIAFNQSNYAVARDYYEQALAIANTIGNKSIACDLNHNLGLIFKNQGDYAAAKTYYNAALYLAQELGSRKSEVKILQSLGVSLKDESNYAEALTYYEQALPLSRQIGDRWTEAALLSSAGTVYRLQGNFDTAQTYQFESLTIFEEIGDPKSEGIVRQNLSILAGMQGDYGQASAYLKQALQIYQQLGFKNGEGMSLFNLGAIHLLQGDYATAQNHLEQAFELHQAIGNGAGQLHALSQLALLYHLFDDNETALDYSEQALALARKMGNRHIEAETLTNAGYAFLGLKNYSEAIANFSDALTLYQEINATVKSLEPLAGLAGTHLEQQQTVQAMGYVEQILDDATTGQLDNSESPSLIYLTCYRVLKASQDPRAARVLDTAYRQVQERAAKITNEKLRHSFLENVTAHREIVQEWQTKGQQ